MSKYLSTILIVEDDPNDMLLIQRALRNAHVVNSIQTVDDGEKAIAYLAGEGAYADREKYPLPALVLLDLKMPRKSGHEVLEWVGRQQSSLKRIPVVVLTSSNEKKDVHRAYDLGANSYLVKPVALDQLIEMVRTLGLYWMVLNEVAEIDESAPGGGTPPAR